MVVQERNLQVSWTSSWLGAERPDTNSFCSSLRCFTSTQVKSIPTRCKPRHEMGQIAYLVAGSAQAAPVITDSKALDHTILSTHWILMDDQIYYVIKQFIKECELTWPIWARNCWDSCGCIRSHPWSIEEWITSKELRICLGWDRSHGSRRATVESTVDSELWCCPSNSLPSPAWKVLASCMYDKMLHHQGLYPRNAMSPWG